MKINLTPAKIEQLGELSKLRTYLSTQVRRLDRSPTEFERVSITFSAKRDTLQDSARGDTELGIALRVALLGHYQAKLAKVDAELDEMGISLADEDRSAVFS